MIRNHSHFCIKQREIILSWVESPKDNIADSENWQVEVSRFDMVTSAKNAALPFIILRLEHDTHHIPPCNITIICKMGFPGGSVSKESACNAGDLV